MMKKRLILLSVLLGALGVLAGMAMVLLHRMEVLLDWDDVDWVFDKAS